MLRIDHVIIAPVTTEKSTAMSEKQKYTFMVHSAADKGDVKKAVKNFYGVEVSDVNIITVQQKKRFYGRGKVLVKRAEGKKAIVALKDGKTLNFNDFK